MKYITILFCLFIFTISAKAQSPYELSWKTDGILTGTTAALFSGNYFAEQFIPLLTQEQVDGLQTTDIPFFDRFANSLHSDAAILRSDIGLTGAAALSSFSTLAISLHERQKSSFLTHFFTLGVMLAETNALTFSTTSLVKNISGRIRPFAYSNDFVLQNHSEKEIRDVKKSFFSRHTSLASANTFFFARVFSDYYPDSKWKSLVWITAAALPAWTGVERVLAGEHFTSDVIAGYLFGATCGYFIPRFHKTGNSESMVIVQVLPYATESANGVSFKLSF